MDIRGFCLFITEVYCIIWMYHYLVIHFPLMDPVLIATSFGYYKQKLCMQAFCGHVF